MRTQTIPGGQLDGGQVGENVLELDGELEDGRPGVAQSELANADQRAASEGAATSTGSESSGKTHTHFLARRLSLFMGLFFEVIIRSKCYMRI
jgi:hypothetical protein